MSRFLALPEDNNILQIKPLSRRRMFQPDPQPEGKPALGKAGFFQAALIST
jgi:hypothetical protein